MGPFTVEKWITFHYVWGGLDIYNQYNHHKSPEAVKLVYAARRSVHQQIFWGKQEIPPGVLRC